MAFTEANRSMIQNRMFQVLSGNWMNEEKTMNTVDNTYSRIPLRAYPMRNSKTRSLRSKFQISVVIFTA